MKISIIGAGQIGGTRRFSALGHEVLSPIPVGPRVSRIWPVRLTRSRFQSKKLTAETWSLSPFRKQRLPNYQPICLLEFPTAW